MKRNTLIVLILLLAAVLLWLGLFWNPEKYTSIDIAQAPKGGDFSLTSVNGPVDLKSMRGNVVVLFFGYTTCPDVCPTSMGVLSSALHVLDQDEVEQVQGLFISVDPERDTLERLQTYSTYFHPRIQGVTGTKDQVAKVAKMYGAAYRKSDESSGANYLVDHTADLYLIDKQGKLHGSIRHGTPPSKLLQLIRELLTK